ncbi:unnamed protein product [Caenorhabditis angaria]|uniref:Uncharacterized protein n=1 Tax=Caenorhabditis angaria TaxID=860376 RepID=A0A9P1N6X4_9PELO|nr:unnamed protein product [Caenorhabditis angaria]
MFESKLDDVGVILHDFGVLLEFFFQHFQHLLLFQQSSKGGGPMMGGGSMGYESGFSGGPMLEGGMGGGGPMWGRRMIMCGMNPYMNMMSFIEYSGKYE